MFVSVLWLLSFTNFCWRLIFLVRLQSRKQVYKLASKYYFHIYSWLIFEPILTQSLALPRHAGWHFHTVHKLLSQGKSASPWVFKECHSLPPPPPHRPQFIPMDSRTSVQEVCKAANLCPDKVCSLFSQRFIWWMVTWELLPSIVPECD